LEVLKYIEWLEGGKELEKPTDYIQETANNVVKLRFINEVKSRMTAEELNNYGEYAKMLQEIPKDLYSYFLEFLEEHTMDGLKKWWNIQRFSTNS